MTYDVPSPIDLRNAEDALQWTLQVNIKRPWRDDFFKLYADSIHALQLDSPKVLEIGSGPGHLAKVLLQQVPDINYHALDFSEPMHQLSRQHLTALADKVSYIIADFKRSDWFEKLDGAMFDVVIIHQALHELRHKDHAPTFHLQVKNHVLKAGGLYLMADHLYAENAMQNNALFMRLEEHLHLLNSVGFASVNILKQLDVFCAFRVFN